MFGHQDLPAFEHTLSDVFCKLGASALHFESLLDSSILLHAGGLVSSDVSKLSE